MKNSLFACAIRDSNGGYRFLLWTTKEARENWQ